MSQILHFFETQQKNLNRFRTTIAIVKSGYYAIQILKRYNVFDLIIMLPFENFYNFEQDSLL